jgi:hypothetical protein
MRAVVHTRCGTLDVLRLEEVPEPVPRADEVRVRVHATTVDRTDCGLRSRRPFFVRAVTSPRRPKRTTRGSELAGDVDAVGDAVTRFAVGDRGLRRQRSQLLGPRRAGVHVRAVDWALHVHRPRPPAAEPVPGPGDRVVGRRRVRVPILRSTQDDVVFLKQLIEAGGYRAVIDRRDPLSDIVETTS